MEAKGPSSQTGSSQPVSSLTLPSHESGRRWSPLCFTGAGVLRRVQYGGFSLPSEMCTSSEVIDGAERDGLAAVCTPLSARATSLSENTREDNRGDVAKLLQIAFSCVVGPPQPQCSMTYAQTDLSRACMEKLVMNRVAQRLGLPPQLHWKDATAALHALSASTADTWFEAEGDGNDTYERGEGRRRKGSLAGLSEGDTQTGGRAPPTSAGHATPTATHAAHRYPSTAVQQFLWSPVGLTASGDAVVMPRRGSRSTAAPPSPSLALSSSSYSADEVFRVHRSTPSTAHSPHSLSSSPSPPSASASVSQVGGGVLHNSTVETYTTVLHTARLQALTRASGGAARFTGKDEEARHAARLVIYCSDQVDPQLLHVARLLCFPHIRVLQTVFSPTAQNYALSMTELRRRVAEDLVAGLYPCIVVGVFGSALSAAVDPLSEMASFCGKAGIWFHIDASHGGASLLARETSAQSRQTGGDTGGADSHMAASLLSFLGEGENVSRPTHEEGEEEDPAWQAVTEDFQRAVGLADSIALPAHSSFLPVPCLPTASHGDDGATSSTAAAATTTMMLLFLNNTVKLSWSLQQLEEARGGTVNGWRTPKRTSMDTLHLCPPHQRGNTLLHSAYCLAYGTEVFPAPSAVRCHQRALQMLQRRLAADGRFDVPLRSHVFGVVYLRWLVLDDEATRRLATQWKTELERALIVGSGLEGPEEEEEGTVGTETAVTPADVQVRLGVVLLQRRTWVAVSFAPLLTTPSYAKAAVQLAMTTLTNAAHAVENG